MTAKIIPVIMCGGAGTRLWPSSRESMPKQFIALFADRSTFQETVLRVADPGLFEKPIIVTSSDFRFIVADQLRQVGASADIVLEPMRRDSGPALAVATVLALRRQADATLLVLASDHAVRHLDRFHLACRQALPAARQGLIVTFGIVPNEPATGYGYLRAGPPLDGGEVRKLEAFAEKPDRARAEKYVDESYLWNSGNFLFAASAMKAEIEQFEPQIWQAAAGAVANATTDLDFIRLAEADFSQAPKISIDYAVMEKSTNTAVLPVDLGWSDLGSWDSIWANADRDGDGNALSGPCEVMDVSNTIVHSDPAILTTVVGVTDLVVVTSADAVLVAPRQVTDEMKTLVERLRRRGRIEATQHRRVYRPWGFYENMTAGGRHQVKRIVVNPGHRLSLQKHLHRSEHWVVVRGTGEVTIDGATTLLHENESTYIPVSAVHRLGNPGHIPLELIEVQVGSYLGEDDIVRLEDAYNRVK